MGAGAIDEKGGSYQDVVTVIQPEFNVEVNILSWFKITGGAGYRIVNDLDKNNDILDYNFSGPTASLGFYFGLFNQKVE